MMRKLLLAIVVFCSLACAAATGDTLNFRTFVSRDDHDDYHDAFLRALAMLAQTGHDTLVIPPGIYPLYAHGDEYHLLVKGLTGKHISGQGATLLFKEYKGGLLLEDLRDVRIEGLSLNYAQAPQIQGEIIERTGRELRVKPDEEFETAALGLLLGADRIWATLHDEEGHRDSRLGSRVLKVKELQPAKSGKDILVYLEPGARLTSVEPGRKLVIVGRFKADHAISVINTERLKLEDLNIYSSPGMGLLAQPGNSALSLRRLHIVPDARRGAYVSTNADGLHIIEPKQSLVIADCQLEGLEDDAIVVSRRGGQAHVSRDGAMLNLERPRALTDEGTPSELEAVRHGIGIESLGSATDASISGQRGTRLKLDKPLDSTAAREAMIIFVKSPTADVRITGNRIINVRARGIRINYPGVRVETNRISETTGAALLAGPFLGEGQWQPQYPPDGLIVRGNRFEALNISRAGRLRDALVEIAPFPYSERGRYGRVIHDVSLIDNRFVFSSESRSSLCAIALSDVQGALIQGNRQVIDSGEDKKEGLDACGIEASNVSDVRHTDNAIGRESGL